MPRNRRLVTDADLQEAMERQTPIRVFQDDAIVASGAWIVRFDDRRVVLQSSVSDLAYFTRDDCELFEMPSR